MQEGQEKKPNQETPEASEMPPQESISGLEAPPDDRERLFASVLSSLKRTKEKVVNFDVSEKALEIVKGWSPETRHRIETLRKLPVVRAGIDMAAVGAGIDLQKLTKLTQIQRFMRPLVIQFVEMPIQGLSVAGTLMPEMMAASTASKVISKIPKMGATEWVMEALKDAENDATQEDSEGRKAVVFGAASKLAKEHRATIAELLGDKKDKSIRKKSAHTHQTRRQPAAHQSTRSSRNRQGSDNRRSTRSSSNSGRRGRQRKRAA